MMLSRRWTQAAVILLSLPVFLPSAAADSVQRVLAASGQAAEGGAWVDVQVVWLNHGDQNVEVTIPDRMLCTVSAGGRRSEEHLFLVDPNAAGQAAIAPGNFHREVYRLNLARQMTGEVTIRLDGAGAATIDVGDGAATAATPTASEFGREGPCPEGHFAENLYAYEPMYFLYGRDPENARFQLSLKYRILNTAEPAAAGWTPLQGLFFGYTQTSLWDLAAASKPFEDTSYKPELFYLRQNLSFAPGEGIERVDFQAGVQHESNGQAGDASRSLNIAYIRPTLFFGDLDGYHLTVSPKIYTYVGDLSENPDIYRYRGYFDLHVDFGSDDGWKFATILRKGTEGDNGSIQLDVTYPMNRLSFGNLDFFLQGQVFSGYGESLLNYDRSDTRFRLGVAVYR